MVQLISSVIRGSENRPMAVDLRYGESATGRPVMIFVHGFKGFKDWGHFPAVGEAMARAGLPFISFNFSHDGTTLERPTDFADLEAFGNNNYSKELFDIGQIIGSVADGTLFPSVKFNRDKIFLLGHSRGGAMAIVKASEDKRVKALATWAAVGDLSRSTADAAQWKKDGVLMMHNSRTKQQMPIYYQFVEDVLRHHDRYDLQKCCGQINVPALFLHGSDDTTVPCADADQLDVWCATGRSMLIEHADHTFGGAHPFKGKELPSASVEAVEATSAHFNRAS